MWMVAPVDAWSGVLQREKGRMPCSIEHSLSSVWELNHSRRTAAAELRVAVMVHSKAWA